ncbi:hypothetical protein C7972_114131 [Arenibacter sp. ARW7G5Y1]|nr:hypothetical protein C7972_114131 [Arenibacter sp. ARW7G5Y1]
MVRLYISQIRIQTSTLFNTPIKFLLGIMITYEQNLDK